MPHIDHLYHRYDEYEKKIFDTLKQVHKWSGGENKWKLKEALDMMLACASCMQLALLHPILPKGGRQLSVLYSPTLCKNNSVKKKLENELKCVCCERWVKLKCNKKCQKSSAALDLDNLEEDYGDEMDDVDDLENMDNQGSRQGRHDSDCSISDRDIFVFSEDEAKARYSNNRKGTGDIVPIGEHLCQIATEGIRHFACESCLQKLVLSGEKCPMCADLFQRVGFNPNSIDDGDDDDDELSADSEISNIGPGHIYCRKVFGGFKASVKLETIVSNFKTKVPSTDKVLIVSFFKGSLDLLEAMFHEHKIEVARFDGDIKVTERQQVLDRFKTKTSCRVLLMTAHTGGTGLNITEANHVWFTERYCKSTLLKRTSHDSMTYSRLLIRFAFYFLCFLRESICIVSTIESYLE